jgi:hypothetical protein
MLVLPSRIFPPLQKFNLIMLQVDSSKRIESSGNLQHISEREPDDWEEDPSLHPTTETMFMEKSKQSIRLGSFN